MPPTSKGGKGVEGISVGGPAHTGEPALMNAVSILSGHKVPKEMEVPLPDVTKLDVTPRHQRRKGANVFPASTGLKVSKASLTTDGAHPSTKEFRGRSRDRPT